MNYDPKQQGDVGQNEPLPTSPDPLSPGRTDIDPTKEPGIDELPNNDGERPLDDDSQLDTERVREETDNAEMDQQPNPR